MLTFNIVLGYQGLLFRDFFWFFFRFFCFSIQLTDPISGNAFNGKQRKKRGMALDIFSFPCWLHSLSFYFWPLASASQGSAVHIFLATNDLIGLLNSHQLHYYTACIIGVLWANRGKCSILCKAQNKRKVQDEEKIVVPVISPLFWLFHPPMPTNIDWCWWCQKDQRKHIPLLQNCYHSGYQKHWQQHKPQEITTTRACMNHQ